MAAKRRKRNEGFSRQWLGWGLAAVAVAGLAYAAIQRQLLEGADLRGQAPGQALACPAGRTTSSLFYSQSEGIGRSFFYWWAYRAAVGDALDQVPCDEQNSKRIIIQGAEHPACEKDGEPACRRMKTNVSDPAFSGKFGRNLARHACQVKRAVRLPHPGWRWGQWEILVNCQVLCSCTQAWKQKEEPVIAPDPEPELPVQQPIIKEPEEPAQNEDQFQPQAPAQEPVATTSPGTQLLLPAV